MDNFQTWKPLGYHYKCYDWNQGRYQVIMCCANIPFGVFHANCHAVTDDFGNLVRVE